jgi:hypothetical protein
LSILEDLFLEQLTRVFLEQSKDSIREENSKIENEAQEVESD